MRDEAYRKRLEADLERWIGAGLIAADKRPAILGTLPAKIERPAAAILSWAGVTLLGLAVIAFIAANWGEIPRIARLGAVLGVFWAALGGAMWVDRQGRAKAREALLLFATLVFAAGLGLVGQMYNLAGEPRDIGLAAGLAGLLLGAAGRSAPAAGAGLLFAGWWYVAGIVETSAPGPDEIMGAAILLLGAGLASFLRSRLVLHLTIFGVYIWLAALIGKTAEALNLDSETWVRVLVLLFAAFWAIIAIWGRSRIQRGKPGGATIYGYGVWFALAAYPWASFDLLDASAAANILHRIVWLGLALAALAYGNKDGQRGIIAAGVISLALAVAFILYDLGLSLMAAAGIFALAALGALGAAWFMARKRKAAA